MSFFLSDTAGTVLAKQVFVMRSAKASYLIYSRWWGRWGGTRWLMHDLFIKVGTIYTGEKQEL